MKSLQSLISTPDDAIQYARRTSRLAAFGAVWIAVAAIFAGLFSAYYKTENNNVVAIPVGSKWEYPAVHWMNTPPRFEEDTKPLFVARKYIHGLYEVDPLDFADFGDPQKSAGSAKLSTRISGLMAYALPNSSEQVKLAEALAASQTQYKLFSECKCVKKFLVTDMMVYGYPHLPVLRVEAIGRFIMFDIDGRRPLPAEDLGIKSIVLAMTKDTPAFSDEDLASITSKGGGGVDKSVLIPKTSNPEGWYVVKSQMRTIDKEELQKLRQIRLDAGMKGVL